VKVGIVGTGPAAFALVEALTAYLKVEVVLFEFGQELLVEKPCTSVEVHEMKRFYSELYGKVKKTVGLKFPPQKSYFHHPLPSHTLEGKKRFPRSQAFGGLSNFWGATMLPMTAEEASEAGFSPETLVESYQAVAKLVGVSGRSDGLTPAYGCEYSTIPAVEQLKGVQGFSEVMNRKSNVAGYHFFSGVNRVAVNTKPDHKNSCVYCGECLLGCFRESIFNSKNRLSEMMTQGVLSLVNERVVKVHRSENGATISTGTSDYHFDKVFLCAGAVGTAEILLRSFAPQEEVILSDNSICQVPILNFSSHSDELKSKYLSLTQAITVIKEGEGSSPQNIAQMQIYPNFDYLWRSAVPEFLWPLLSPLVEWSRDRLLWGRLYTHGSYGWKYQLSLNSEQELKINLMQHPVKEVSKKFIKALACQLKGSGYRVVDFKPMFAKTSSHLAIKKPASLQIDSLGRIANNIFVCDGAYFEESPATSLTFSIMANSYRIGKAVALGEC
jgi:hypothetical protein